MDAEEATPAWQAIESRLMEIVRITRGLMEAGVHGEVPVEYIAEEFYGKSTEGMQFALFAFSITEIAQLQRKLEATQRDD